MESTEEVAISIYIDGMEISAMKVAHLRALLEKKSGLPVNRKKKIVLKNTLERVLLQERVLQVSS